MSKSILDLQENNEGSTQFPYTLCPVSPAVTVLAWFVTLNKTAPLLLTKVHPFWGISLILTYYPFSTPESHLRYHMPLVDMSPWH